MDWQFGVGVGIAVVFGLLPFAVKDMPQWVTWPGITIGLLFIVWGVISEYVRIPTGPAVLFILCVAGIVLSGTWYVSVPANAPTVMLSPSAASGILVPEEKTLFSLTERSLITKVQIGTSNVIIAANEVSPYRDILFPALTKAQFLVETIDGKIKFSTKITNEDGHLLVQIQQNEWKIAPPPGTWDRNYTKDSLEVKDAKGIIVLQAKALQDRIQIQGIWWTDLGPPNGYVRLVARKDPNGTGAQLTFVPRNNREPIPEIVPMFEYPSDLHLGELRK